MNNANVQTIQHTDVKGNKILYLKITVGTNEVLINIGQKNFDALSKLLQPRETATQLNILPEEKTKKAS